MSLNARLHPATNFPNGKPVKRFVQLAPEAWGYKTPDLEPREIVEQLVNEVRGGIATYRIVSIDLERATSRDGYQRVYVEMPISMELFDVFFNGRSGYRAQYAASEEAGEDYNRFVVTSVAPLLLNARQLYTENVTTELCERSLMGNFTKIWFSKEITSPDYEVTLLDLPESIRVGKWKKYWLSRSAPRKGLLTPKPESPVVLFNGSFVHPDGWQIWDQKPGRSREIAASGWT